ncbi:MAG: histidine kinase dimerization/phosphoacceptor domain -containing protein, partial [Gammaproteobacteria bacterium]
GEVFAEWRRPEATHGDWAPSQIYRISLTRDHFTVSEPVIGNGQNYGRIVILASTAELRAQLFDYLGAVLIVAGLVLPIAVLLAYRMQAGISGSIRHLAGVAQRISHEDDLNVRVTPRTSDEIADLYNAFNDMIARLQQRQEERDRAYAELDQIRAQLEERVALRTHQYREANEALEREFARLQRAEVKISQALAEKETLLREIHHRVKNNLQVVHSLLSLQLEPGNDGHTASLLEDARQRVKTIALVHETLYQSDNLADVEALAFIRRITDNVARIFHNSAAGIRLLTEADDLRLDIDQAIPLGLVINELVTNAFKYAFAGRTAGTIRISLRHADQGEWVLEVADDGGGLPPGLDLGKPTTLGLMLVQALVGQLRGKVEVTGRPGTRFSARFPAA